MRQITIYNENAVNESVSVLKQGGVILYPTDTVYGLGVDATNHEAVEKIVNIKEREGEKTFLIMVSDIEMLRTYAEVNSTAETLVHEFLPGALTLVLNTKGESLGAVTREDGSVGFRIPNHPFCLELAKTLQKPIVSTSANISGNMTQERVENILEQLGEKTNQIDIAVDGGSVMKNTPSTIVDARREKITILRSGAISEDLLSAFL